jgi:hypothetical protein
MKMFGCLTSQASGSRISLFCSSKPFITVPKCSQVSCSVSGYYWLGKIDGRTQFQ